MYYRPKALDWALIITHGGTRAQLAPRRMGGTGGKGDQVNTPYAARSGIRPAPALIVDTAQFVFAVPVKDKKVKGTDAASDAKIAEALRRHSEYTELVRQWAATDPDNPAVIQLLHFLDTTGLRGLQLPAAVEAGHAVGILADNQWLHELPSARTFWADEVRRRKSSKSSTGICLACNTSGPLLDTIPVDLKPGLIPGGGTTGPKLISVNKAAHGRDGVSSGLASTPICEPCGANAMSALNYLLADEDHHHRGPDYALTWWTRPTAPDPGIRGLNEMNPNPSNIAHLLDCLQSRPSPASVNRAKTGAFYGLTLSTNNGRVVVRDWIDVPLDEIKANLGAWYADTQVWNGWNDQSRYTPIWLLAAATGRYDKNSGRYVSKTALAGIDSELMTTAIRNTAPPARILPRVLRRVQIDGRIDTARIALVRLCLTRSARGPMTDKLDPILPEASYHCGRIFAVLEDIQRAALPDISATITDKHLGQAMRAPGSVFPTLRVNAQAHLKRLRRDKPGLAFTLAESLANCFEPIDFVTGGIPNTLDTHNQGMFLLGYEHQRAERFAAIAAKKKDQGSGEDDDTPEP